MSRRDPSRLSQFIPREHAEPIDTAVLKCSMCGATAVQHIAIGDGWRAASMPSGGIGYVCTKDICGKSARENGIAVVIGDTE